MAEYTKRDSEIAARFFEALDVLKERGEIGGVKTICDRYGIDRRNLYKVKADPSRKIFSPSWLAFMVEDFGVDARWILTGKGSIFGRKNANKMQIKNGDA